MSSSRDGISAASFRDPSGYVVRWNGEFFRVIQPSYSDHYQHLMASGLYNDLVNKKLLIPHSEVDNHSFSGAFKVIKPRQLSFISYPYEWCFSQLKDAALATLEIQKTALAYGMSLKDASAFNIQFVDGAPMLVDTLSFEKLKLQPWVAYGQFCRHFLAPLALMAYRDPRLNQLLRSQLDGISLPLAGKLLPWNSRLKPWLLLHLHLHAATERKSSGKRVKVSHRSNYRLTSLQGLVQSLESAVHKIGWRPAKEVWANYYDCTVTGGDYVGHKRKLVADHLKVVAPGMVWDLGANTGMFSRIAADAGAETISFDGDPDCIEINYIEVRKNREGRILPLVMDLSNPTPGLGWEHCERMSWLDRSKPDATLALALVHHLAIGNNVPLNRLSDFFARLSPSLIIEFVPKDDPNAQKLLDVREDVFSKYTREEFEIQFTRHFEILECNQLQNSNRILYLMRKRAV